MPRTVPAALLLALFIAAGLAADAPEGDPGPLAVTIEKDPKVSEASQNLYPTVYGPFNEDGSRPAYLRSKMLGRRVQVEGIAWGQPFGLKGQEGTLSPHVLPHVIHQGESVFIKGIDFTAKNHRGALVRVTGTLRLEQGTRTRFGDVLPYFYIEATTYETIEAVKDPYVVTVGEE